MEIFFHPFLICREVSRGNSSEINFGSLPWANTITFGQGVRFGPVLDGYYSQNGQVMNMKPL